MATSKSSNPTNNSAQEYKLVIYRSEDFKEVRSMGLSLRSIYVALSSTFLLLAILIFLLLAFTPLKRLVPGYGELEANKEFLQLVNGVDEIGTQIEAQGTYLSALKTMLTAGTGAGTNVEEVPDIDVRGLATSVNIMSPFNAVPPSRTRESAVLGPSLDTDLYDALEAGSAVQPVNGLVSSTFDPSIKHYGVDILAPAKSPIVAMMNGIVFSSGWDPETGYSLAIQHEGNILSFYKHNSQLLKEKGTFVRAGEAVAIIGNTGTLSSGPHLHFELWHNGKPINPEDVFKF